MKPFEADQFPYKHWDSDNNQAIKAWADFRERYITEKPSSEPAFNFRINLIDYLKPFVNKRGIRQSPFKGEEHEVKLVQLDTIPGNGKILYRNWKKEVGTMIPVYVSSKETLKKDLEKESKRLFKKAKKL